MFRRTWRCDGHCGCFENQRQTEIGTGHCDLTANVHDWYVGVRNGKVNAFGRFQRGHAY